MAVAALAALAGAAGTTLAVSMGAVPAQRMSLFSSDVEDSRFEVTAIDADLLGLASLEVAVALDNLDDAAAHAADVRVQVLDASGEVLHEDTGATGTVDPGATWSGTFRFASDGLAEEYARAVVLVEDTG